MPKLSPVKRLRIILDLLKDGEVTDATKYDAVDMVPPADVEKQAQVYWTNYNQQATDVDAEGVETPREPTKNALCRFTLNMIRKEMKRELKARRIAEDRLRAATVESDAETEADADLGVDETED